MPKAKPDPLRAPLQRRSRETLDRIAAATVELLDTKTFDEISITDITRRARSSVGAFYSRFEDKNGVLHYLDQLYEEEVRRVCEEVEEASGSLERMVPKLVAALVRLHRERRGLLRTLVRRESARASLATDRLAKLLLRHRSRIPHPNPDVAVSLGLAMVAGAIQARTLAPVRSGAPVTDAVLASELAQALLGYLDKSF